DRVGVLHAIGVGDDELVTSRMQRLASVAAELVVSKSAFGDIIVKTSRVRPVTIAAELRWSMLPPLTFENDSVSVAAILEPSYEVAGDSFDYAASRTSVQLALFDAMGHGLEASRMSDLAMAAFRFARRSNLDVLGQHATIDQVLHQEFGPDKFVTGQLAELDLETGVLSIVSAGHPPPLHLRGTNVIGMIETTSTPPMGLALGTPTVTEVTLEPGDVVLFFTDGVTEARSPAGEQFGVELLADYLSRAASSGEPPSELLRRLTHRIIEHVNGALDDDATLLLLRWKQPRSQTQ
ncbi:MAG TPA: PP2C family protein-serine/threonine phosphatase, partial [Acidimicrobiales bacterium]|nr:PP2C family protein-serine/threonine phosphatase [Acidimicrobiales bacterium]